MWYFRKTNVNNMAESHRFLLICLITVLIVLVQSSTISEFTVVELQESILSSIKQPVCVLYKKKGFRSPFEKKYTKFWKNVTLSNQYTSWISGTFPTNKYTFLRDDHIPVGGIPKKVPIVRCYIGYHAFDSRNTTTIKGLHKWFQELMIEKYNQLPEASEELIFNKSLSSDILVVGFSGAKHHHDVESMLIPLREQWSREKVEVLFVHDQSQDAEKLAKLYGVKDKPSVVFIENTPRSRNQPVAIKVLRTHHVTKPDIDMFLTLRFIKATAANKHNFIAMCGILSKFYVPMLMLFHHPTAQNSQNTLSMFHGTVDYLEKFDLNLRFGTMEIDSSSIDTAASHVKFVRTQRMPFIVFMRSQWEKTTVVGIEQILIKVRPTLSNIVDVLQQNKGLVNNRNIDINITLPWGVSNPNKLSLLIEGPHGSMCTPFSHNTTNNEPWVYIRKRKVYKPKTVIQMNITEEANVTKEEIPIIEEKDIFSNWHDRYDMENIESKLPHIGELPMVTTDSWQDVIEKSHAPLHPFYADEKWQGEITKTSLVIYIIADCGSCSRKMPLFKELHKAIKFVDGGALYIANCTSDPQLCKNNKVTGFPTLLAYRGLGWKDTSHCTMKNTEELAEPVEMEYFGVLMQKYVMDWFVKVSGQAVKNYRFKELEKLSQIDTARLVATVIPKSSRYMLKLTHTLAETSYPFECLRLACERLYGQIACHLHYHPQVPKDHFKEEENEELVITQINLQRSDGFNSTFMKIGKPIKETLKKEATSNVDQFHKPHKYEFPPGRVKCESLPAFCTDLIVDFSKDHGRLPITKVTLEVFHTRNSLVFHNNLPILVGLVYKENITANSSFGEMLQDVALATYNEFAVVTIDAEEFSTWAHKFVPEGYFIFDKDNPDKKTSMHFFPRFCVVYWNDHHHAAFYPPVSETVDEEHPFNFNSKNIFRFLQEFLKNSKKMMVKTGHF